MAINSTTTASHAAVVFYTLSNSPQPDCDFGVILAEIGAMVVFLQPPLLKAGGVMQLNVIVL